MRRPEHVMTKSPGSWLGLVLLLAPGGAWAGTFYVSVVPARVVSAERVVGYSLEDPFEQLQQPAPTPANPPARPSILDHFKGMSDGTASVFEPQWQPVRPRNWPRLVHRKAKVCRVRVHVQHRFWGSANPVSLYGSPELCDRVKAGDAIHLQNFGLVDLYRFVSLQLGDAWFRLPLMRETRNKDIQRCFNETVPASKDKLDEEDLCGQLVHAQAL
ncbi:hypothetical protein ACLESD_39780 [Pyxidicoccus sp. 3LFB2]